MRQTGRYCPRARTTTVKGPERPTKVCPVCERPFQWRARWRLNWEQVKYCSRRCAGNRDKLNRR
ncbi:MAG: DUF2256 domain-containing protein [Haliea sp.]